jgi:integrase
VDRFAEQRQRRYIPPISDFWKVYEAAETKQDRFMLLAYLHTAARRAELFRLCWTDVDFNRGELVLSTRKRMDGSLEYDELPMTDDLYAALLEHKLSSSSSRVFVNPVTNCAFAERKLWMRGLCKKAGVKPFGLHSIRHLTASILAAAGVSSMDIQAVLRHRKLTTTERYLHRIAGVKASLQLLPKREAAKGADIPLGGFSKLPPCYCQVTEVTVRNWRGRRDLNPRPPA